MLSLKNIKDVRGKKGRLRVRIVWVCVGRSNIKYLRWGKWIKFLGWDREERRDIIVVFYGGYVDIYVFIVVVLTRGIESEK